MKKYTAAVVGAGRIGWTLGFDKKREQPASHVMALKKNRRIKLIAGVDNNPKTLALFHSKNPLVRACSSVDELYQNCSPDIVVVAVNEDAHLGVTLDVLSRSPKLVILEKPVALNLKQAAKIKAAAKKYGVPILVNHERRFALDYNAASQYLAQIGGVQMISAKLFSGMKLYDPDAEESGAYSLLHDGTQLVYLVLFLLENLSGMQGGSERALLKNPVVTGIFRDPKNKNVVRELCAHYSTKVCPQVSLFMSGRSRFFGFELDILGTEGRVCIGNGYAKFYKRFESNLYTGFYSLSRDKKIVLPKKTGYFANMVQNAVDFLDGRRPLMSTLQTGINALAVLEDIKNCL
ncbi:MAG: Gfo/Idh/MocA family oxidoreductase [Treponema sp.]|nr:Gfo/Idh/MocA family oxidoreductase [Treponema sp.]